jgi:hypothetical protein
VPPSGWSWPGRLLARSSAWLHLGGAWRDVPRDSGDNEAEGITIVTVIKSTKQGRNVIQGLEDGESGGERHDSRAVVAAALTWPSAR